MLLYINKALSFILETLGNNHFGVFQISEKKKIHSQLFNTFSLV